VHHAVAQHSQPQAFSLASLEPDVPTIARIAHHPNAEIDRLELPRIEDETELEALKADGSLLEIRAGEMLRFDPRLDPSRRFCRPWTRDLSKISARPITTASISRFR